MTNQKLFKEHMTALAEIHGKALTALLNSLYWKTLESFTDEQCEAAFKELIFSSKFFPKPADFLEILRGKQEDQATLAWVKVIETLRRHGPWASVCFDDPVIHSIIKFMGGWGSLGDWKNSELVWKQKNFINLYGVMSRGNGKHPQYLPGLCETDNDFKGWDNKEEIIKIGFDDQNKKEVFRIEGA
jgi:hypothetical protein